ncbi:hypothetical protein NX059_003245 [Plenodomus lindquistii]|nr:hypothetical protein NX059_003245 [Plenodomus lindquistii]
MGSEIVAIEIGEDNLPLLEQSTSSNEVDREETAHGHTQWHQEDRMIGTDKYDGQNPGAEQRTFYVHKSVLCKTSRFFQTATKPEWSGTGPHTIVLPNEIPGIFHMYTQWLYTDKLAVKLRLFKEVDEGGVESESEQVSLSHLVQSYLLGEMLMDSVYQRAIMGTLIRWVKNENTYPANFLVRWAYEGTTEGSPLRRLLVDFWVWEASATWVTKKLVEDTCVEFAQDVIVALVEKRPSPVHEDQGTDSRPWIAFPKKYDLNN